MQSADIHSALAAAVEEVLETMCFTTVLADSQEPPPPEPDGASLALGAKGSVSKPFAPETLRAELERSLGVVNAIG